MPLSLDIPVSDIASAIQIAIAPIFLLVGTGSLLNVVTTRLGRVIDRSRVLEAAIEGGEAAILENRHVDELGVLDRRMKYGNRAVLFCCVSIVLICVLVAVLFIATFVGFSTGLLVAILFISVVSSLTFGVISFLMEVTIATSLLRVRTELLTRSRRSSIDERER